MFKQTKKQPQRPSHPSIERARKVATLLDSSITIPIIRKKIGLDPILGLLPVGGDAIGALLAAYLLWVAIELRLPKSVAVRIGVNIVVDCFIGMVPVVGDMADALWKSNQWNLKLLEEAYELHGEGTRDTENTDKRRNGTQGPTIDVLAEPVSG